MTLRSLFIRYIVNIPRSTSKKSNCLYIRCDYARFIIVKKCVLILIYRLFLCFLSFDKNESIFSQKQEICQERLCNTHKYSDAKLIKEMFVGRQYWKASLILQPKKSFKWKRYLHNIVYHQRLCHEIVILL